MKKNGVIKIKGSRYEISILAFGEHGVSTISRFVSKILGIKVDRKNNGNNLNYVKIEATRIDSSGLRGKREILNLLVGDTLIFESKTKIIVE